MLSTVANGIRSAVEKIKNDAEEAIAKIEPAVKRSIVAAKSDLMTEMRRIVSDLRRLLTDELRKIQNLAKTIGSTELKAFHSAADKLSKLAKDVYETVRSKAESTIENIKDALSGIQRSDITREVEQALHSIKDVIESVIKDVYNEIHELAEAAKHEVSKSISYLENGIVSTAKTIGSTMEQDIGRAMDSARWAVTRVGKDLPVSAFKDTMDLTVDVGEGIAEHALSLLKSTIQIVITILMLLIYAIAYVFGWLDTKLGLPSSYHV